MANDYCDVKDLTGARLANGRTAHLTEAGWEISPWTTDKRELIFESLGYAILWGERHDENGKMLKNKESK